MNIKRIMPYAIWVIVIIQWIIIGCDYSKENELRSDIHFFESVYKLDQNVIDTYEQLVDSIYVKYKSK